MPEVEAGQVTSEEVVPPVPAAEEQSTEAKPEGEQPEGEQETTEQQEAKKLSKFQRRLERQKTARIQAETRAQMLEERLAKLEGQRAQPQGPQPPKREDFDSYEDYMDARADYRADQKIQAAREADAKARQGREAQQRQSQGNEEIAKTWNQKEAEFKKATPDYEESVSQFVDEGLKDFSKGAREAIVEFGPQMLHYLATHEDVAERIADLSPARQVTELGKLEETFQKPTQKASSAPAPARPVSGKSSAGRDPTKMSMSEYLAYRKTQGLR